MIFEAGTGKGGDAEGDTLVNVENVLGSKHNDVLTGDGGSNTLLGGNGDDDIDGGAGDDIIFSGPGDDDIEGGAGNDLIFDGWGWIWS